MSELNLSIPITFSAESALEINGEVNEIKQTVQSYTGQYSQIKQNADSISLRVNNIESGLESAGIDIDTGTITLDAAKTQIKNGDIVTAMFTGGKLKADYIDAQTLFSNDVTAYKFETTGSGIYNTDLEKAHITIEDGLLQVYGNSGVANIVMGSYNGQAILRYFDNTGTMLYDLGPDGINKITNTSEHSTVFYSYAIFRYSMQTSSYSVSNWFNDYYAENYSTSQDYDGTDYTSFVDTAMAIQVSPGNYYVNDSLMSFLHRVVYEGYTNAFGNNPIPYYLYTAGKGSVTGINKGSWATVELATMADGKFFKSNPCGTTKDATWYNNNLLNATFIVRYNGAPYTYEYLSTNGLTEGTDYIVQGGPDNDGYYDIEWLLGTREALNNTGDTFGTNFCKATDEGFGVYRFVNPIIAIKIKAIHNGVELDAAPDLGEYEAWFYISKNNVAYM